MKTFDEINEKIKRGDAVVVTAEEMVTVVQEQGAKKAAETVDVVTTGTFGPMCSSGAFLNFGHSKPRIKVQRAWLNNVLAYAGLAAVDIYIGATEVPDSDPLNRVHPGEFRYGGGHVIQDLVAGKDVRLTCEAYGTDCYPRTELDTWINIKDLNECILCNPRNAYQNYNVAVNLSDKDIYTYMGVVKRDLGSASFCSAGQLSPLLKDPTYRTIGIGTRLFLGGGVGYVFFWGTQHNPTAARCENQTPTCGAGTLSVAGDLKQMSDRYLVGVSFYGYGTSLAVGLGIPIPVLDEEVAAAAGVSDAELRAPIIDYSQGYPYFDGGPLGSVSYAELKSGSIEVKGKKIPTTPLSSYVRAQEIAKALKEWIQAGQFLLGRPVDPIPGPETGYSFKLLNERPVTGGR